jgi:ABC-2 type transport system permease protein
VNAASLTGVSAIVVRELRGRMRGRKAFVFLSFYLVVLALLIYLGLGGMTAGPPLGAIEQANMGKGLFIGIILVETLIVAALAPAYTAGSIAQEREKQTYDLLVVTPITSLSIALGKLLSGLAYLLILVLASIPLAALGFFFGGVEPGAFIPPYLVLVAGAIGLGSVGVFFSALFKRTQPATIATYICLVAGAVGTVFAGAFWFRLTDDPQARPPEAIYYFNPYYAQADVFCDLTLEYSFCSSLPGAQFEVMAPVPAAPVGVEGGPVPMPIQDEPRITGTGTGFWIRSSLFWLGLAAVMLLAAARFISPTHRWRPGVAVRAPSLQPGPEVEG